MVTGYEVKMYRDIEVLARESAAQTRALVALSEAVARLAEAVTDLAEKALSETGDGARWK